MQSECKSGRFRLNGYKRTKSDEIEFLTDAAASDDHDINEDLMQLFSVVNIRIQKVSFFEKFKQLILTNYYSKNFHLNDR